MCILFHRWGAWSKPEEFISKVYHSMTGEVINTGAVLAQTRICSVCGKAETKRVKGF